MGHTLFLRHVHIAIVSVFVLAAASCMSYIPPDNPETATSTSCCPQEMCANLFDRLEEQSNRLQNLEEVLLHTVYIITAANNDHEFSTSTILKSDPITSMLISGGSPIETTLPPRNPLAKFFPHHHR